METLGRRRCHGLDQSQSEMDGFTPMGGQTTAVGIPQSAPRELKSLINNNNNSLLVLATPSWPPIRSA